MTEPTSTADAKTGTSARRSVAHELASILGTRAFQQAALFVAAVVIAGAVMIWYVLDAASRLVSEQIVETISVEIDALSAAAFSPAAALLPAEIDKRAGASPHHVYLLVGADDQRIAGNLPRWPSSIARPRSGNEGRSTSGLLSYLPAGETLPRRVVGMAQALGDGRALLVGRDVDHSRALVERARAIYLVGFGTLALLGLGAGFVMSRRALRRVEEIAATSDGIVTGDLSRRVRITSSGDELDRIAANLNAMLDRLENLLAAMREVSDNVAHDLKTPLTRLRARAETAQRATDPEQVRAGMSRVIEDADEIIKTFNALLLVARLEAGAVDASMEVFDLTGLVVDLAELYEPVADEAGFVFTLNAAPSVEIRANRQLVGQAIANMLDNAIKYAKPETGEARIALSIFSGGGTISIAVADNGPGIPPGDRDRVLKRFVRLERSRTKPGTGLGLSLLAAVARLHHGRVRLEDNSPGLKVVLELPAHQRQGNT